MKAAIALAVAAAFATAALAEGVPSGKYKGTYTIDTRTGPQPVALEVDITSVEGDRVSARGSVTARNCGGEFPMEGRWKGGELTLRSTQKYGSSGDCSLSIKLRAEGDKLVGTTARGTAVQLAK